MCQPVRGPLRSPDMNAIIGEYIHQALRQRHGTVLVPECAQMSVVVIAIEAILSQIGWIEIHAAKNRRYRGPRGILDRNKLPPHVSLAKAELAELSQAFVFLNTVDECWDRGVAQGGERVD